MSTAARYLRQLDIFNPEEHSDASVTFVGVGGIGSFAAFGAAKLGIPNITLIDPDTVEEHNQPNQFYTTDEVGTHKTEALADSIVADVGAVALHPCEFQEVQDEFSGVVVSGLDSMEARAELYERLKLNFRVPLYIDARIGGQLIVLYAFNPLNLDDCEHYEKTLHTDEEAEELPCTERGVIDVGLIVGSLITRALRRHYAGLPIDKVTLFNQETLTITKGEWVGA